MKTTRWMGLSDNYYYYFYVFYDNNKDNYMRLVERYTQICLDSLKVTSN